MKLFKHLETLPWEMGSLIAITVFVLFAISGIILVRKTITVKNLRAHHDVAGFIFANLGVLYSVLLGFTVVNVQQRFDKARETTHIEASVLAQLYRDSEVFSEGNGRVIRNSIKNYLTAVIQDEWPKMAIKENSPKSEEALNNIWKAYYAMEFDSIKQQVWYAESISKLNQLTSSRLDRLMSSVDSLGPEMWASLILGGLLIVSFLWFFSLDSLLTHILMASILASVTAFLLFLIYSLDTSFAGDINIAPQAFENVLKSLKPDM